MSQANSTFSLQHSVMSSLANSSSRQPPLTYWEWERSRTLWNPHTHSWWPQLNQIAENRLWERLQGHIINAYAKLKMLWHTTSQYAFRSLFTPVHFHKNEWKTFPQRKLQSCVNFPNRKLFDKCTYVCIWLTLSSFIKNKIKHNNRA